VYAIVNKTSHSQWLTPSQIRIVVDTHAHEKPNKKKKPHRGYAFVVFEREKDMRGKYEPFPV
jgi:U1 small nuclear ribonucleoprotein